MEGLTISLIDLNRGSQSLVAQELRALFQTADDRVRLHEPQSPFEKKSGEFFEHPPDALFLILPENVGEVERALIRTFSREPAATPIIAVMEHGKTNEMIELFKLGVSDFITPPLSVCDVMPRLWRLTEHVRKKNSLIERLKETIGLRQIIGESPAFTAELQKIPFVSGCDSSVLIAGETGTGKEMFARAIHYLGPRANKPFTPVNCGAIPTDLIENELFGHTKGAFTSAMTSVSGLIYETDGGTLFLDEIDSLPLAAQVKLLRFLQEKEYRQLGSAKTRRADIRIIAATNTELEQAVQEGTFRQDLYYRLNIVRLALPPLRERTEDIPLLARHFLSNAADELGRQMMDFAPEAMWKLTGHEWPGNVRELENIIKRAVIFSKGNTIRQEEIDLPIAQSPSQPKSFQAEKARVVAEFESRYMREILEAHRGNITMAAKAARKNRRAFWELLRKYNIDAQKFRPLSS